MGQRFGAILCDAVTILIGAFSKKDRSLEKSSQYLSLWACYALPFFLGVFALVLAYGDDSVAGLIAQQSGLPWHWNISRHVAGIPAFLSVYGAILIWTREQKVGFDFGFYGSELLLLALLAKGRWFFMHFLLVSLFLGGWVFPFSLGFLGQGSNFIEFSFVLGKTLLAMAASILILRSFPRLNIDLAVRWGWTAVGFLLAFFRYCFPYFLHSFGVIHEQRFYFKAIDLRYPEDRAALFWHR